MIAAVVWLGLGLAADDTLLAPTLADFDRSLARVERLLESAHDEGVRLGLAQSAWIDAGCLTGPCDVTRAAAVAVEVQEAGHHDRELIQGARAELDRLRRISVEQTVAPLVDAPRHARLAAAVSRASVAANTWSVRVAWYTRFVAPWVAAHADAVRAACVPTKATP